MMDQPQSQVAQEFKQGSAHKQSQCIEQPLNIIAPGSNFSSQKIESIEEFISKLRADLEADKKIIINGQMYEVESQQDKHSFGHEPSSMGSFNTQPSFNARSDDIKNFSQGQQQKISDKQEMKPQGLQYLSNLNNLNMNLICEKLKLEEDNLLIIGDYDFSTSPKFKSNTFETPMPPEQQQTIKTSLPHPQSLVPITPPVPAPLAQPQIQELPKIKRHNSEQSSINQFIVSQNRICHQQPLLLNQGQIIQQLQEQLALQLQQINKMSSQINCLTQSLAKIYSNPGQLTKDIQDEELLKLISKGFPSSSRLHLAFLFSSPLIYRKNDDNNGGQINTMAQIDYNKEFQCVVQSLSDTQNNITLRRIPATLDNLRKTLTENPIALHFSGHGMENNEKNFGRDSIKLRDQGNFLILEENEGCAQFLSEKRLHELIEASGTKLEFVFVASCYSQFAGEIFHQAGAKHVICVKKGFQISDEAAIIFSRNFYHALFSQTVTVCQAFEIAKSAMKAEKSARLSEEWKKFVLLKDTENCNIFASKKEHKCYVFGPFIKGSIENIGIKPIFTLETSKVEDFIGRMKEMHEIISCILQNRLVTIKGMPGIGKTTIAKAIISFLDERLVFNDGIIILSLRGLDQANMILTRLQLIISKHLPKEAKEDKTALESFHQIQEKILNFMKDKEVLICLDNAEDTLRKEGNHFREILQSLLINCPRLKLLLTSRYPIGQFGDISEKIYTLKELTPQFAIELLMKKAKRNIDKCEIQELINDSNPSRVLHSNPVGQKKDIKRLDEHHLSTLLGGHPHAISLAAPLLQDKTLKELYSLLNTPDIIKWLQIEGIEGTPIASLKVSLDTSIEYLSEHEPIAIDLFCFIGLFPGGVTDEDLNNFWKHGWIKYTEKLLRASLLVKKIGTCNETRYTLFPFMNQYAVQLMNEEVKQKSHKRICNYLAKICKDLLKLSQTEIINRLVAFETNIWACIYRIIDKYQGSNDQVSRSKSPGAFLRESQSMMKSFNDKKSVYKSQDESSHGGNSSERIIDPSEEEFYESILYTKRDDRSISQSGTQKRQRNLAYEYEINNNHKSQTFRGNFDQTSNQELQARDQSQIQQQPQSLALSGYEEAKPISLMNRSDPGYVVQQDDFNQTSKLQQTDAQLSLILSCNSQTDRVKERLQKFGNAESINSIIENTSFNDMSESIGLNCTSSAEEGVSFNPSQENSTLSYVDKKSQKLNKHQLKALPFNKNQQVNNFLSNFNDIEDDSQSVINYQHDQAETSSIDSLQHQLLNMTQCQDQVANNQNRRRSTYKSMKQLDNISETLDEDSCFAQEDDLQSQRVNDKGSTDIQQSDLEEEDTPKTSKMFSSKKYQEDEDQSLAGSSVLQLPQTHPIYHQSGEKEQSSGEEKKHKTSKRVRIQEEAPKSFIFDDKQEFNHQIGCCVHQNMSLVSLSPDGSLIVYYVTNLVILGKYEEANKTIENFGLKIKDDQLCIANLKRIQAYILSNTTQEYKQIIEKYEQAQRIFSKLKISSGQALCLCAVGFLMYHYPNAFIEKNMNENKVFDKAMRKLEEAATLYQKTNHFVGEAFCHKILTFIKKKIGESYIDNQRKQKNLMLKDNTLQQQGRSTFIHLFGGRVEVSLFLEVIQQSSESHVSRETLYSLKNQKGKQGHECPCASNPRQKPRKQQEELKHEAVLQNQKKPKNKRKDERDFEFDQMKNLIRQKQKEQKITIDAQEEAKNDMKPGKIPKGSKVNQRETLKIGKTDSSRANKEPQNKPIEHFKIEEQSTINLSDNEMSNLNQCSSRNQQPEKRRQSLIQAQNTMQHIQKYHERRNEQIMNAKKSQLSSSFIQPRNSVADPSQQIKPQKTNKVVIGSQLKKEEVKQIKVKKNEEQEQNDPFEKAIDVESLRQNSDDEVQSIFDRSSIISQQKDNLLGPKKSNNPQMNSGRSSGRYSARPSIGQSQIQNQVPSRSTLGTSKSKQTLKPPEAVVKTTKELSRQSSPNMTKKSPTAGQPAAMTTTTTTNVQGMQLNITTTTTVKIEVPVQAVESKPQIIVESVEDKTQE